MTSENSVSDRGLRTTADKYMTFKLAAEEYGLAIIKVRELIGLLEITRVPLAPAFIRGVINLRGKVIPVVDLRAKFGLKTVETTSQNVIIVVQLGSTNAGHTMGILVDEVLEVRAISDRDIDPPPTFQTQAVADFIQGVGKADKRIVFLLDIDRVLNGTEASRVADAIG